MTTTPDTWSPTAFHEITRRAIRAAVPPSHYIDRKIRPDSEHTWSEPAPLAGLHAALAVVKVAQQQAYKHIRDLRGEGTSWREAADLLDIPWSNEYSRPERAYELVLGPDPEDASPYRNRNVYWRCGGPLGCGNHITDRGPYNGHPRDDEDGHADDCRRLAAEIDAYKQGSEQQEERDRRADQAMQTIEIIHDTFALETVTRARWVQAHGGRYRGWSTSETLAVALVLHDGKTLQRMSHSENSAVDRVTASMSHPPRDIRAWLSTVRTAATGD